MCSRWGSAQLAASLNDYQDQIRAQAERLLNDAAAQARELGLSQETLRVSHEDPRIRPSSTPPPSAAAT